MPSLPCPSPKDGEIDLKMLAKFLSPEEDVKEVCVVCIYGFVSVIKEAW